MIENGILSSSLLGISVGLIMNLNIWAMVGGLCFTCGIITIKHEIFWRIERARHKK